MTELAAELLELERRLQTGPVRRSTAEVEALLAPDFCEFGSSGRVFERAAILAELGDELPVTITMTDFAMAALADGVVLVTYRASSVREGVVLDSLRSSVWLRSDAGWRMRFHQGTRVTP